MRLKSDWPTARNTPTTIESAPRNMRMLDTVAFGPITLNMMRAIAYTPIALMSTPESIAEIGAGALGCASGSHAWNGTVEALRPKPMMNIAMTNATALLMPMNLDLPREVGHVERARHRVEERDAEEDRRARHARRG